jgi:hypothetical protein
MRGQTKNVKKITLSGNVYLLHHHEEELDNPQIGDVYLCINDEKELYSIILNNYKTNGYKGYFKARIYDGYDWGVLNNIDFFEDKINHFSKKDICFYNFPSCQERIEGYAGSPVYRTYREHYTLHLHVSGEYKGKRSKKK